MKHTILPIVAILSSACFISNVSSEESSSLSANIGLVSQYHFRGIQQTGGASTSVGLDYESGSVSVGTWAADVQDGLEVDLYGAYAFEINDASSFSVGFTSYQYTGDFDSAYNEINLGYTMSDFEASYSIGKWDGVVGNESATEGNYTILTLAYTAGSFTGTIGVYGDDAEGEYFDLSYGAEIGGFDIGVGLLVSGSDLNDDESLYFSFGKEFDL
ncbi:MAG: hypothetical protein COA86_08765 [Kangiella sp.]|nr:MAG: hypothetical protein COA86_08765 [Kangiella sp.]